MKGLQKKSDSGVIFLAVKHNSLVRESKGPKEGFEEIEVDNPRTKEKVKKYIERFSAVEGMVTKIEWYDTEQKYENRYQGWKIHLDAAGDPVVLDLPFSSIPASRFMKLAENINWAKPVEFRAWKDIKRDATAFWVGQDNESVLQKYTKDNPGECPAPTQNARGKWNYDAQMDWLFGRMKDVVVPAVEKANAWRVEGKESEPAGDTNGDAPADFDFDDLHEKVTELAEQDTKGDEKAILVKYFGAETWEEVQAMPIPVLASVKTTIVDKILPF